MYLGNIEYNTNFVMLRGVIVAEEPIAHGTPGSNSNGGKNNRPIRKMTLNVGGSLVEVPCVSSIHMTHHFRTLMMLDLLKQAGFTSEKLFDLRDKAPEFYQTLFSGGSLEKVERESSSQDANPDGGDEEKLKSKKGRKSKSKTILKDLFPSPDSFTELFYPARLFGSALFWLNEMAESVVGVGHVWPLTSETAALFNLSASTLREKFGVVGNLPQAVELTQVEPAVYVRTDETAKGKRGEDEGDARMIYNVYYIPAGTRFVHEVNIEAKKDIKLALSAFRYLTEKLLPKNPFIGGLVKRGYGKVKFEYPAAEWDDEKIGTEMYEEYVREKAPAVQEKIEAVIAGAN